MPELDALWVRVPDVARAGAFFTSVFDWRFRPVARDETAIEVAPWLPRSDSSTSPRLVLCDHPASPPVRLGLTSADLGTTAERVRHLGGRVEERRGDASSLWCFDDQGTPMILCGPPGPSPAPGPSRVSRGALGVIFIFVDEPERAAIFYGKLMGWRFTAIGRDRDILVVDSGPPVGLRPAVKAPTGHSGSLTFHLSVPDPDTVMASIRSGGGTVGPVLPAGTFATRACTDDQATAFSLWYQPPA